MINRVSLQKLREYCQADGAIDNDVASGVIMEMISHGIPEEGEPSEAIYMYLSQEAITTLMDNLALKIEQVMHGMKFPNDDGMDYIWHPSDLDTAIDDKDELVSALIRHCRDALETLELMKVVLVA